MDPIQQVLHDMDRVTRALGRLQSDLTSTTESVTETALPRGFVDVRHFQETLGTLQLEARRAAERLQNAVKEAYLR